MYLPYQRLANAIIEQAAKDYRAVLFTYKHRPHDRLVLDSVHRLENFFFSEWYMALTDLDASVLVRKIRQEVLGDPELPFSLCSNQKGM